MTVKIINGDCRDVLKTLASESINCVVTSPPYFGLRDYGVAGQIGLEETPDKFVAELVSVFREVRRVLRNDGTLWLNLGDSYAGSWGAQGHRVTESDDPSWHSSQIKNHPKRASKTGSIKQPGLKPKDLIGIPWRVAFALQADGWYLRQDIIWHKPNPMPESVQDRCTKAHEYIFLLSKCQGYYFDAESIKEDAKTNDSRRPYTSNGAKELDGRQEWKSGQLRDGDDFTKRNRRSVWTVPVKPFKGAHFATFPPELIEPCILAGCPVDGTVIDPFGGAGTTGLVASRLQRNAVLIELNQSYAQMAHGRIFDDAPLLSGDAA